MKADADRQPLVLPATADDFEFTHDLTRCNMEDYVVRHWGAWSRDIYTENYHKGRNFVVWASEDRIGYVRFLVQPPTLILDDLQIAATRQGQGFGSFVLAHLISRLPEFACTAIRLRVFHDNPARRLYLRAGFQEIERNDGSSILQRNA